MIDGNKKKLLLALFAVISCCIDAFAQERLINLTLEEALRLAIQQNHRLDTGRRNILIAQEQVEIERSGFLPSLTLRSMYSQLNAPPQITVPAGALGPIPANDIDLRIGNRNPHDARLTLEQPVFTGMATTYRYRIAKKETKITHCSLEQAQIDIVLETKKRYFELLRTQRIKEMTFFAIKVLEDHLRVSRELYGVGMITKNDLLKSQVALGDGKYDDLRADNMLSTTKLSFKKFLNIEEDMDLHIDDMLDYQAAAIDIDASIQQALRDRPEITVEKLNIQSASLEASLHRSEYFPNVKVVGNIGNQEGQLGLEKHYWDVGVFVTWKLWEGGITAHKVAQSLLKERESERRLYELKRDIRLEVRRSALDVLEAQKRIQSMQETVAQAEENLRISEERYREQVTTSTEVLDALALLVKIRIQYYTSIYDFHIAKSEFERATSEGGSICS